MVIDTVSPSELNDFLRCPAKWHYRELDVGTVPVPTGARTIGTVTHEIIGKYLNLLPANPTVDDISAKIKSAREVTERVRMVSGREKFKTCMKNLRKYEKRRLKTWSEFVPTFTEKHISMDLPNVDGVSKMTGRIDFYGNNNIIDWKTSTYTKMSSDRIRQGMMYKMLAENEGYTVDKVYFVFLPANEAKITPVESYSWIKSNIRKMIGMIRENDYPHRPTALCDYCEYRFACKYRDNGIFNSAPKLGEGPLFVSEKKKEGDVLSERKRKQFIDDDDFFGG